jgi:hypothetical protein
VLRKFFIPVRVGPSIQIASCCVLAPTALRQRCAEIFCPASRPEVMGQPANASTLAIASSTAKSVSVWKRRATWPRHSCRAQAEDT